VVVFYLLRHLLEVRNTGAVRASVITYKVAC
jgi:hypothetical protein